MSYLEVWVYQEADSTGDVPNIYVHHDLLLPAFPLSLAWVGCEELGVAPGRNFAAVGTSEPGIEIWDLDVADAVEPVLTLGGVVKGAEPASNGTPAEETPVEGKKTKKKRKKAQAAAELAEATSSSASQVPVLLVHSHSTRVSSSCSPVCC